MTRPQSCGITKYCVPWGRKFVVQALVIFAWLGSNVSCQLLVLVLPSLVTRRLIQNPVAQSDCMSASAFSGGLPEEGLGEGLGEGVGGVDQSGRASLRGDRYSCWDCCP